MIWWIAPMLVIAVVGTVISEWDAHQHRKRWEPTERAFACPACDRAGHFIEECETCGGTGVVKDVVPRYRSGKEYMSKDEKERFMWARREP